MKVTFITGNDSKFDEAERSALQYGVEVIQRKLDIRELQSNDVEEIAKDKAQQAFEILKQPLFVNDSGWSIPALNGFPGSFMSYVNEWFTAEDFIKLVSDKADRSIILEEILVYIDQDGEMNVFRQSRPGTILDQPRGNGRYTCDSVVSFDGEHSIAEYYEKFGQPPEDNDDAYSELFRFLSGN